MKIQFYYQTLKFQLDFSHKCLISTNPSTRQCPEKKACCRLSNISHSEQNCLLQRAVANCRVTSRVVDGLVLYKKNLMSLKHNFNLQSHRLLFQSAKILCVCVCVCLYMHIQYPYFKKSFFDKDFLKNDSNIF